MPTRLAFRSMTQGNTSTRTRIETSSLLLLGVCLFLPRAILPPEQGLKRVERDSEPRERRAQGNTSTRTRIETGEKVIADGGRWTPRAILPPEQGLKRHKGESMSKRIFTQGNTSTRTRIETQQGRT